MSTLHGENNPSYAPGGGALGPVTQHPEPRGPAGGAYGRMVVWVCANLRLAGLLVLVALAPAAVLAVQYFRDVHAGLQELLPDDAPSVRALQEIHARVGGVANLFVIARSPDPAVNRRFVTELAARLRARRVPQARSIQDGVRDERRWIQDHAALLLPSARFEPLMADVETAVRRSHDAANPFFVDLGDETPAQAWDRITAALERESQATDRFPNGYLETPDGRTVVLGIALRGSEVDIEPSEALLGAVRAEVSALRPRYPAGLQVAYNGEVVNLTEEHAAILADVSLSSILVFVVVGALIVGYFRSLRGVAAVLLGLYPGLLLTFALGRLSGSFLNSNSAFLGSIIAGNGINYPLLYLAYYRAQSVDVPRPRAIAAAARQALPGTLAAAATASAAYLGLAAATFRGFSQFGWLGGVGMLTTWAATFVMMPITIAWLDPPRQGARVTVAQRRVGDFFARPGLSLSVAAGVVLLVAVVAAVGVRRAWREGTYDMNLLNLRNSQSLRTGGASWDATISRVFGVWINPVVALVPDGSLREPVARELRRVMLAGPRPVAERVETIDQYVPAADEQSARIARLARLRTDLADVPPERIPARARPFIDAWLAPGNLRVITLADVPRALSRPFTEVSGRTDQMVLLFPSLRINYNDGRNILRFVSALSRARLPPGTVVGGGFVFMAEIIRLVRAEAPRVVLTVCLLVALVLVPIFGRRPARVPVVVGTVALVAVSAQAVMFAVGVRLNMLNFAALPITIGVGADYVVNLLGAMDAFGVDARRACVRMGGAILLCSLTTVVGYTSLLLAHSGALRSFGWAAVLGEVMAATTVLLVLPAVLPSRGREG